MNIKEVYMLNDNYRMLYAKMPYPYLHIQIGDHVWFLREGTITKSSYSYSHQELAEWLFDRVFI